MRRASSILTLIAAFMVLAWVLPARATLQLLKPNLAVNATFVGHGGYSADGLGQEGTGGTVQAEVPVGATVARAYLYGTYNITEPDLETRTIDIDGTSVVLDKISDVGDLSTARAEVTSQVAAKVGAGPGPIYNFAVNSDPDFLDGVALVVIYELSSLPVTTIAVLDGSASQAGDTATLTFAQPIDKTQPGFAARLSLGSGFSFQGPFSIGHECGTTAQSSIIDVNGSRLTSCAGNYDDGAGNNGALITVGGVGDSPNNPTNPNQQAGDGTLPRGEDDELYDLSSFIAQGATQLTIASSNPSQDDNLFLAVIAITGEATVTTEVCGDGVDNDGDGLVDNNDPDCVAPAVNTTTTYTGPASVQYSDPVTLSGKLETSGPAGVAGKTLGFTVGTQSTSAGPTDASGAATASPLVVTQEPGSVSTAATSFAGDSSYLASSDSDPFSIAKENCVLAYSGDTLVTPVTPTRLAADMGELDTSLGDRSGKQVTFSVVDAALNLSTYNATTDATGHAETMQALADGVYGVSVSFAGDDFYKACSTATDTLVTVQAAGSKVTGGGWFSNPNRTSFGFNAVPQAGGAFKGQFQLRTSNGKNKFHGPTVTIPVSCSPAKACTWGGSGRWNGASGYTFTIWVIDNGSSGSKKGDQIKIEIRNASNALVYSSSGFQTLKGGNITVH